MKEVTCYINNATAIPEARASLLNTFNNPFIVRCCIVGVSPLSDIGPINGRCVHNSDRLGCLLAYHFIIAVANWLQYPLLIISGMIRPLYDCRSVCRASAVYINRLAAAITFDPVSAITVRDDIPFLIKAAGIRRLYQLSTGGCRRSRHGKG